MALTKGPASRSEGLAYINRLGMAVSKVLR